MTALDSLLDQKVLDFYINQNVGTENNPQQRNLYSKEEYKRILEPVIRIMKEYPYENLDEWRERLFQQSGIEEKVRKFIYDRQELPGTVFCYGDQNYSEVIVAGNSRECTMDESGNYVPVCIPMTNDSEFDLASVTKLFTSLVVSKLVAKGLIDLNATITHFVPDMKNLKSATIYDVLTFRKVIKSGPIEQAKSFEEAREMLFDSYIDGSFAGANAYNDRNAMVLKYVVEAATGMPFEHVVEELIIKPLGLTATITSSKKASVELSGKIVSNNYCYRLLKDGTITLDNKVLHGMPFDEKARILCNDGLSGHAGIFSNIEDLTKLAREITSGTSQLARIYEIGKNKTGEVFSNQDGKIVWKQHLGELSYSKNPVAENSEVHHALSGVTIASAGWNCTQLTADPINGIHFAMGGNKPHSRFALIAPNQRDKMIQYGNGKRTVKLTSGLEVPVSAYTAWTRDEYVRDPAIELAMQNQFLSELHSSEKECFRNGSKIRTIGERPS